MSFFNRQKIGLLPYISEELSNKSPNDPQFRGWEIVKFNIDDCWAKSDGDGVVVAVFVY